MQKERIMQLCSNHHEEICFDGHHCPACDLVDRVDDLEKELKQEQKARTEDESSLEDCQYKIEQLTEECIALQSKVQCLEKNNE